MPPGMVSEQERPLVRGKRGRGGPEDAHPPFDTLVDYLRPSDQAAAGRGWRGAGTGTSFSPSSSFGGDVLASP